ncbi:plasmid segregation protein ParM [Lachnospiraceae bacterium KHCPX20]|nr:plasmid segregation protein ParM [Lachnospiraceae bacterium KHCPX20]
MSQIKTTEFATKSEWFRCENPRKDNKHVIGLDMGYSGAKGFYEDGYFCIPNFSVQIQGELFGEPREDDILYEDLQTHKKYFVGRAAIESLNTESVTDEGNLFGREHYMSSNFLIMARTALGLALWDVKTEGKDILLQTGLPPAFLSGDEVYIRYVFEREHIFKLSVGKTTKRFHFTLKKDNIDVMKQPMGTFYSVAFDTNAKITKTGMSLFKSNTIIFDGGFGTLDKFVLMNNGRQAVSDTQPQLGMKRVFEEARQMIQTELGISISIPGLQNCLKTGVVEKVDRIKMDFEEYPIQKYIDKANTLVQKEAMEYIKNDIFNARYLIMTGGTGAAWYDDFKMWVDKTMKGRCQVMEGNEGTGISNIYANARGYYMAGLNAVLR